jgi:hypothetical protein
MQVPREIDIICREIDSLGLLLLKYKIKVNGLLYSVQYVRKFSCHVPRKIMDLVYITRPMGFIFAHVTIYKESQTVSID